MELLNSKIKKTNFTPNKKNINMNKSIILTLLITISSLLGFSQDFDTDQESFIKSYTLENEGDFSKAVSTLKATYKADSYEYNLRLGWLDYLAGQYTESQTYYNKAISIKPLSLEAKFGLIYPLLALGKVQQAEDTYLDILKISPLETTANYRLALSYYQQKKYKEADNHLRNIINLYPFDYDIIILMAWNSYQMGKSSEARLLFQKALLNRPNDESAIEGLKL